MDDYHVQPGTEAIEKLENFITVNRLKANTRIPSERDLCEMWSVKRATLRNAVDTLVQWGVLYRVKGSGVYVAEPKIVRNLVGVTSLNDEIRQKGILMSTKIEDMRIIEATKQISRKLRIPLGRSVYEYTRRKIVGQIPAIMEVSYIDCKRYPDFAKHYNNKTSMDYLFQNLYHKYPVSGEEKISVTYVSEYEANLLELEQGAPVFFTSGVTCDEDDVPMIYYKSLFRADQFKMVSAINKRHR